MKKEIKCLIFDFGCVIGHPQDQSVVREICSLLEVAYEEYTPLYFDYRKEYDRGTVNAMEYWQQIGDSLNVKIDDAMLGKLIELDVKSWTRINESTLAFIKEMKKKASKIAILSNINFEPLIYLKEKYDWMNEFDAEIYSCEIKTIKPEAKIYEHTIEKLGYKPEECLFIDDSYDNIEGAKALGINGIVFESFEQMKADFDNKYLVCH